MNPPIEMRYLPVYVWKHAEYSWIVSRTVIDQPAAWIAVTHSGPVALGIALCNIAEANGKSPVYGSLFLNNIPFVILDHYRVIQLRCDQSGRLKIGPAIHNSAPLHEVFKRIMLDDLTSGYLTIPNER